MKTTLALLIALGMSGCGAWDRGVASVTGTNAGRGGCTGIGQGGVRVCDPRV